jgi:hypothetical protein
VAAQHWRWSYRSCMIVASIIEIVIAVRLTAGAA